MTGEGVESLAASSLGVAEACRCRRRRVHTSEGPKQQRGNAKTNRGKEKFQQNLALAVVPLKPAVVPLLAFLLEFCAILGSKTSSNPWENGKIEAKQLKQGWRGF